MGVPMLVFPHWVDQYTNRMLVVNQWKFRLKLETCRHDGLIERAEITRPTKFLLGSNEGEEMRRRDKEMIETIRKQRVQEDLLG